MIYHDFKDLQLSSIGMGCMRLPTTGTYDGFIDVTRVEEMVDYALSQGLNYFDTAWGYHSGRSETVIGTCLKRHPRDSYHLATKFPGYNVDNFARKEEIFEEQLNKTQSDCFDFYLLHNVIELNIEQYLDTSSRGLVPYLLQQKKRGLIKHLGFSCHGEFETLVRLVETWGDEMEFAQIQLNYQDWFFQHADSKVEWLNEHNIPIVAMEPLRGGLLADPPASVAKVFEDAGELSPAAWGLRFVASQPNIITVLSGMNSMDQMRDNIAALKGFDRLNSEEMEVIAKAQAAFDAFDLIPCTGCNYCAKVCPENIGISGAFLALNANIMFGRHVQEWLNAGAGKNPPSKCIECYSCEQACPQSISIVEELKRAAEVIG